MKKAFTAALLVKLFQTLTSKATSIILYSGATPQRAHKSDAGFDLSANEGITLPPGEFRLVPTGTSIALPRGWEAQIRPRSGLAAKHGITVLNSPGTIDAGYRGEIMVNLINHGKETVTIKKGDRIAQLVPRKLDRTVFFQVTTLPEAEERGYAGHGSTGK